MFRKVGKFYRNIRRHNPDKRSLEEEEPQI